VKNDLISIVMPTYNSESFLSEALESLRRQKNQRFELLVCDGGSTDGTLDLINKTMGRQARIVSYSDSGVPDALNKGFSAAKGEILCWLNSDDVFVASNALSKVRESFASGDCDVAIFDAVSLLESGVVSKTLISFAPPNSSPSSGGNVFTGSLFFSKAAWDLFGGFSCRYSLAFEYELTDQIFAVCQVRKIKSVVGGFRIHETGLSSLYRSKMDAEVRHLRSDVRMLKKGQQYIHRLMQHSLDGNLHRVFWHRYFDPNRGLHWRDIERLGWVG